MTNSTLSFLVLATFLFSTGSLAIPATGRNCRASFDKAIRAVDHMTINQVTKGKDYSNLSEALRKEVVSRLREGFLENLRFSKKTFCDDDLRLMELNKSAANMILADFIGVGNFTGNDILD